MIEKANNPERYVPPGGEDAPAAERADGEKRARFDPEALLRGLTHRPGVYRMLDARGEVIYVGKARDLRRRVSSYFQGRAQDAKTMALVRAAADVEVTVTRTATAAMVADDNLLKRHRPRANVGLVERKLS